jgi:hypothetical protein
MEISDVNNHSKVLSRHAYRLVLVVVTANLMACADMGKSDDFAAAHAQVAAGDQQALWRQQAGGPDLGHLQAGTGSVTVARVIEVEEIPTARAEQKILPQVPTQVLMERVPAQAFGEKPLATRGRVVGVQAEMLTIRAPEGLVQLQTRVGGRTLVFAEGEEVDVEIRSGTPFSRSDYLQLRGASDALGYALVGGNAPVTIELSFFNLTARQEGPRGSDNSMGVTIQVAGESQRIENLGEAIHFQTAGLFVQVLASIAADENTAAVLPESHRLEIVVWPDQN